MNILLLTDFSENSRNAVTYALQLFKNIPCTFHFLHVTPLRVQRNKSSWPPEIQSKFTDLVEWAEKQKTNADHDFTISYRTDFLIEAVREIALEKKIDLVLMGTKGTNKSKDLLVGRNTADVMRKVKYPMLAVSGSAVYHPKQHIVFPTDYKVKCTLSMLKVLQQLSLLSGSKVRVLELLKAQPLSADQLENKNFLLESCDCELSQSRVGAQIGSLIPNKVASNNILVMVAKNLALWGTIFKTGPTQMQHFTADQPLLILH